MMRTLLSDIEKFNQASSEQDSAAMNRLQHVVPYVRAMEDYSQASFEYNYEGMNANRWVLPVMEAMHKEEP
jgi:hypothetical protein